MSKKEWRLLALILLLGLALRLFAIGAESLWGDEISSINIAGLDLPQLLEKTSREVYPPLYFSLLHYWLKLFGSSEFYVRLLSAIFGFLAVFLIYKLGDLLFNKEVGLLAALILAISQFNIHYSQEARMYSLLALLSLLSIYFFLRLFQERTLKVCLGYLIFSTLLIYTQVFGWFTILSQNLYLLLLFWLSRESYHAQVRGWIKKWFRLQALLLFFFLPWLGIFVTQVINLQKVDFWIPAGEFYSLIDTLVEYSGSGVLFLIFIPLSFCALTDFSRVKGQSSGQAPFNLPANSPWVFSFAGLKKCLFLLVWLLTPILIPLLLSRFLVPFYLTKYAISAAPAFYLLAAYGLSKLNSRKLRVALISLMILLSFLNLSGYYGKPQKDQWREVAGYVDQNAQSGDLLVFSRSFCQRYFEHYSKRTDLNKKVIHFKGDKIRHWEFQPELEESIRGYPRVWFVLVYVGKYDRGLIKGSLSRDYNLALDKQFTGIELAGFTKK